MLGIIFVGALLAGAATATGNCPPTLRVVATSHRDAGLQVGAHFRTMIQDRFSRSAQLPKLRAFAATAGGFAALESLLAGARGLYGGQYLDEMEALADGAGLNRTDAALMNFRHELGALAPGGTAPSAAAAYSECSDVASAGFVAHNEDGFDPHNNHTYVLNVSIAGESTSWWAAYCYAGELATAAFGANSNGVGYTLNAMHCPTRLGKGALGRNLISRALLVQRSLASAKALITGSVSATGHNYQVFQKGLPARVLSIETLPPQQSHVTDLLPGTHNPGSPLRVLFHANCYFFIPLNGSSGGRRDGVTADQSTSAAPAWQTLHCLDANADSAARVGRASSLPAPLTLELALAILGDEAGAAGGYPIYADPRAPPNADGRTTLNTVVWDVERGVARLLGGNPTASPPEVCAIWQL